MKAVVVHNLKKTMKGMMFFIPFFLVQSFNSFAQVDPQNPDDLIDYRRTVLQLRVEEVMQARLNGINQCARNTRNTEVESLSYELGNTLYLSSGKNVQKLLHLLDLFRRVELFKKSICKEYIKLSDRSLYNNERRRFDWILEAIPSSCFSPLNTNCIAKRYAIMSRIDPHCVTKVSASYDGKKDTNACFAGISVAIDALSKYPKEKSLAKELDLFLENFQSTVANAKTNDSIEWTKLFKNYWTFGRENRDFFYLAIMEYFMLATTSNAGVVEAFGDHFWMQPLKEGASAGTALKLFESMKDRKDFFRDVLTIAEDKKLKFTYAYFDMTNANRHNFMSAMIACDFRKKFGTVDSHLIPLLLGYAYESKDFVSHLKGGVSLEKSLENFITDTTRYKQGLKIGNVLCK